MSDLRVTFTSAPCTQGCKLMTGAPPMKLAASAQTWGSQANGGGVTAVDTAAGMRRPRLQPATGIAGHEACSV